MVMHPCVFTGECSGQPSVVKADGSDAASPRLPLRYVTILGMSQNEHHTNSHLHCIRCSPTATRPSCEEREEMVKHCLLYCPAYAQPPDRFAYVHGGSSALSLTTLLSRPKSLHCLCRYVHTTGRFAHTHGDVTIPSRKGGRK